MFIQPDWPVPAQIKAYTTLRHTPGEFYLTLDDDNQERIEQNRHLLKTRLHLPTDPIWLKQSHSTIVVEATPENREKIADAAFTTQPNRICIALTADCLPVLLCNKQGTHVAAIHAGWRGLANGIIEATLQAVKQPSDELLIWLGPAIGPQKFEVGQDVYDAFTQKHEASRQAFTPFSERTWLADLYTLARIRLQLQGISQIYGGNFCTYSEKDRFFSYRRDKGKKGNMASLIWISED